jgi:hypothetical protein
MWVVAAKINKSISLIASEDLHYRPFDGRPLANVLGGLRLTLLKPRREGGSQLTAGRRMDGLPSTIKRSYGLPSSALVCRFPLRY